MESPRPGAGLLYDAIRYARGSLACVTPDLLPRPTPCAEWDLAALLQHVGDSLAAFGESIAVGAIGPRPAPPVSGHADLISTVQARARMLQAACAAAGSDRAVAVADRCLVGRTVAAVGAVEIAVHGWDVAQACGCRRPIPPGLAAGLLNVVPLVVTDAIRDGRFDPPVTVPPRSSPGDRLVALLGRTY